jgi:hypothetical protein
MNAELIRMWKETIVVYLKVIPWQSTGGAEENYEDS